MSESPVTLLFLVFCIALLAQLTALSTRLAKNLGISTINQLIFTNIIFIVAVGLQFDVGDGYGWLICGIHIRGGLLQHYFEHNGPQWNMITLLVHFGLWIQLRIKMRALTK